MERMKDDEQTSLHEEIFAALYKHNPRWYDAIRYVYYLEIPQSAVAERMEISIEVQNSLPTEQENGSEKSLNEQQVSKRHPFS